MDKRIISRKSERGKCRPTFTVGISKFWIPINTEPLQEIWVDSAQFEVAVTWLERTAGNPDRPRKLRAVLRKEAQRDLARNLIEKGVLIREGDGYVMAEVCRSHFAFWRDREG